MTEQDKFIDVLEKYTQDKSLQNIILSAFHTTRWTDNEQSIYMVLTDKEYSDAIISFIDDLNDNGYKIVKT